MNELTDAGALHCANCGTPLEGEYCHHCGQSVHSVLKPVHHMLEDGMDMFLHVDGRIFHTLPPLLTRPGFLTLEYFSGRRQRYVAPFRLMFVLCLLAFFAFHLAVDVVVNKRVAASEQARAGGHDTFAQARTPQEVQDQLTKALGQLEATRKTVPAAAVPGIDVAESQLRDHANTRLAELGKAPARPSSAAASNDAELDRSAHVTSKIDHQIVHVRWLPQFMNERLDLYVHRMLTNVKEALGDDRETRQLARERLITGVFAVLPQAMVVMIPIFALLLKLFYVFKRRLYMEHLIVALHSHAFLFLGLLLVAVLGMLSTWLRPHAAWTGYVLGYLQGAALLWMPIYLLFMQKRIYHQGWAMTAVKYWFIGWSYFWLLSTVLGLALVLGAGH